MNKVRRYWREKGWSKNKKVVPGIELGLPESESDVLTITLYNHLWEANFEHNVDVAQINTSVRKSNLNTFLTSHNRVCPLRIIET
jgi:hypothetical protein